MNGLQGTERQMHAPLVVLSIVDRLAQAWRLSGAFPPVLGEIWCVVVEATAPVQRAIDPPRLLTTIRNRSGYLLFDGTYADPGDSARLWPLAAGTYRVQVLSELYRDAEFQLDWPPAGDEGRIRIARKDNADSVELYPGAAYPLPDLTLNRLQLGPTILRGTAFAANGTALAGVPVEAIDLPLLRPGRLPPLDDWPFMRTESGTNGNWALVLPDRRYIDKAPELPPANAAPLKKQIAVRVGYPDGAVVTRQDVLLGSEHSVRNTALRGQVLGLGGRPIAGARIGTSVGPRTSATGADGLWTVYFDLNQEAVANVSVSATLPGQAPRTDTSATLLPGSTVFVPTFHFP